MASGYCPYILQGIQNVAGLNTPQYKINAHGLVEMLVTTGDPDAIQIGKYNGNKKTVDVSYRQRYTAAQVSTTKSCDHLLIPSKLEGTVSVNNTVFLPVHLEDGLLELYCEEQAQQMQIGGTTPNVGASREIVDIIYSAANALLQKMNTTLSGLVSFGNNLGHSPVVSTAQTWNIVISSVNQGDLSKGMPMLLYDYGVNNYVGRPQVVGSGLAYAYMLSQAYKGMDQSGFNSKVATEFVDFYHDRDFPTGITGGGANYIGVFAPGSIQLVQYLQYTGWQSGQKGLSEFFTIQLPLVDPTRNMVVPVKFDVQLRYFDCPQTYTDAYSGQSATVQKGWSLFISKQFGLWQIYSDAYRAEDPNFQTNGALLYNVTNS